MVCFAADNCRQRLGNDEPLVQLDVLEQHLNPVLVSANMFMLESDLHSDRCNCCDIAVCSFDRYFKPDYYTITSISRMGLKAARTQD